jgi:hypothetical protein
MRSIAKVRGARFPMLRLAVAGLASSACTLAPVRVAQAQTHASRPATPAEHLGRPCGGDFTLADWQEVSGYFRRLDAESPRVVTQTLGQTTEGRDFLISIVSSEANLARLEEIRGHARTIADPRGRSEQERRQAVEQGRVILFVSPQMHSTETAGTQFGMEFAHRLASSDEEPYRTARERLVVCIFACTNPDGLDHVVQWYRGNVGTPFEAADLVRLYQLYSGHDNNRDWFMLTQAETRLVTEQLYTVWFPQVYWDVHQQGSNRERLFVPPFRDPLNPNLDPAIIAGIDVLGSRALLDMTRAGLTGVSTGVTYDMWWNGGNRNVPVRHNIIGLLTEAASVNLASPIFLARDDLRPPAGLDHYAPSNQFPAPWPGGWWRLRDIIDYEHAFGRSLLASLAREPETWLRNALEASERVIRAGREEAPRGWIIPSDNRDPAAVRRLVEVLLRSGVEIGVCDGEILADGRRYPAGSILIQRDQPYGAHAKDLLEVQRYPDGEPPYDVAGWTLPALLGVRRVEVVERIDPPQRRVSDAGPAVAAFAGDPRVAGRGDVVSTRHGDAWTRLALGLSAGKPGRMVLDGERAGLILEGPAVEGEDRALVIDALPRVGVYAPWFGSMDEGWLRWVLDDLRVPYLRVRNEMIRAGNLGDFLDVLVIADVSGGQLDGGRAAGTVQREYAGGLAPEGAVAVEEFVRGGGTLVTLDASSQWAIDLMRLPLVNVTREESNRDFSCPGSVLRGVPEPHDLTTDLPQSIALFFSGSAAWREMTEKERGDAGHPPAELETLLRYAPTRVLLSGWIRRPEAIAGRSAWIRAAYGAGAVHLFAFRPQYRGWTQGTVPLLLRAILLEQAARG